MRQRAGRIGTPEGVTGCAALAAALLCLAVPARADKESILLDFQAASGCPSRSEFVARVRTFTTKAEISTDDGSPHRKFAIRLVRFAGGVRGELAIDDRGVKTTRSVSGSTCDEVGSALALATALAVDPEALGAEPAGTPAEPAKTPKPEPPKPPVAKTPPPAAPAQLKTPPAKPEHRHALDVSLGARVGDSLAPFAKFDGTVELGSTFFAPLDVHLGAAFGPAQHNQQAEFADVLAWLGTGYRFLELEPLSVWGQAAFELGEVAALGRGITPSRRVDRLWAALDVGLSARIDAPGALFFQLNASGRAPLSLQRYVVQENTGKLRELHQVQQLGYLMGFSVGMHFL